MSLSDLFIPQAIAAESGGDPNAQNPTSSASGILQYTTPMWNNVVQKYGDQYGLTLDGKNDPRQQEKATQALVNNEYVPWFQSKGVTPNTTDLYQMHFWGQPSMEKMMAAPGDAKLTDVLGPGAYKANKGLFGNNPDISVTDATNAVARNFNKNGLNSVTVAQKPLPPGAQTFPGDPGDPGADPQGNTTPMSGTLNGLPPNLLLQSGQPQPGQPQAPQVPDSSFGFNPQTLLAIARGMGSGRTFTDSLGNTAAALQQQQQQGLQNQMGAADFQLKQQQAHSQAIGDASKLMEMGVPPGMALGIATGQVPADQAQQALQGMTMTGGRGTKGDTYVTPDGHTIQETQRPFGPPTLTDMSTGQVIKTLPPGAMRPQDTYYKTMAGGEGKAEDAAANAALAAPKRLADLDSLKDLVPQIASGQDLLSTVRRNFTNLTGLPLAGNDATAQQVASQMFDQLKVARMGLLHGFGRVDLPMVKAVQAAGPNWGQNPDALNAVIEYSKIEPQRQLQMQKDWNVAKANGAAGSLGYRKFAMDWEDQHPMEDDVRKALSFPSSQANPGTPAAPGNNQAATATPGIIRYDATGNRIQ